MRDRLDGAEPLEVRRRHEGHQRVVGLDHRRQSAHLARHVDAGFDDRVAGDTRLDARERERHADVVVEVALRGEDRRRLAEQTREEILRRGLARAAGDADRLGAGTAAVQPRDLLKRGERIGDDQLRQLGGFDRARHQRGHGAGARCRPEEVVPVAFLRAQRHKHLPRLHGA